MRRQDGLDGQRVSDDDWSLEEEIAALRQTLRRVMAEAQLADDVTKSAGTIARLSEALVKAVRAHHALRGTQHDELHDAFERILGDLGLGADE